MAFVYGENGEIYDYLKEKNEGIKTSLANRMQELLAEKSKELKNKVKYGFRAMMQIEDELMQFPLMSAEKFSALDYDDIEYYWRSFHALMAYYNMYFEIVPTRQTFMLYMSINSRMYKQLVKGGEMENEDIKELMEFIEDRLVGKAFTAGEIGDADSKALNSRLRAKDVGHSVITASESQLIETAEKTSPLDIAKRLEAVLGGSYKLPKGK
jgi:hypothetical protein